MVLSKQFKRYRSMVFMVIINMVIFTILFLSLIHYNNDYNRSIGLKNLQDVQHIINTTTLSASYFIDSKYNKIQDIRYYATNHNSTVEETIQYIYESTSNDYHSIQLINDKGVGYQITPQDVQMYQEIEYDFSDINLKNLFMSQAVLRSAYVQYTPEFINAYNNEKSIAFYTKLYLEQEGEIGVYTLLSVVNIETIYETLNYQNAYNGLSVLLCDSYGNYIIKEDQFDSNNFFTYISTHNHLSEISRYDLHSRVYNSKEGILFYKNSINKDTMFCYNCIEDKGWFVIGAIPVDAFEERIDVARLGLRVAVLLILVLMADLIWMGIIKKRLERSMDTQQNQNKIIEEALQEAQSANMAKTVFLNNISHDIRTPMNAVIGFTSLAQANLDDKWAIKDYLDKILTSSKHLLNIINDVLDMSRIENGKIKVKESQVNIEELLNNIFKILQPNLKEKRMNFQMETSQLSHINVMCDRNKLDQILLNIMTNAIKYTPQGGLITLIAAENKSHKKGYASYEFTIKDRGVGISAEFLPHVFEPFEKERLPDSAENEGSGLGMAITKSYVDMLGGSISVISKKNAGTTVAVKLQFKVCDKNTEQVDVNSFIKPEETNLEFTDRRILVAENDSLTREIIEHSLTDAGFDVEIATDGQRAVDLINDKQYRYYDAVILNLDLAGLNGFETAKTIRNSNVISNTEIPIFAITDSLDDELKQKALKAGINDFINKPVNTDNILQLLKKQY